MTLKRNKQDEASREFWDFVDRTAQEVSSWPDWKKGGPTGSEQPPEPPRAPPPTDKRDQEPK
jgi:hypothetical protein